MRTINAVSRYQIILPNLLTNKLTNLIYYFPYKTCGADIGLPPTRRSLKGLSYMVAKAPATAKERLGLFSECCEIPE